MVQILAMSKISNPCKSKKIADGKILIFIFLFVLLEKGF